MPHRSALLLVILGAALVYGGYRALHVDTRPAPAVERQVMGVDVFLQLIDASVYRERVLPAHRAFLEAQDVRPLAELLREASRTLERGGPGSPNAEQLMLSPEILAGELDILEGRSFYSSEGEEARGRKTSAEDLERFVNEQVAPDLVQVLALVWAPGLEPESNLGRGLLNPYLRQHSPWLDDVLTQAKSITGGTLEIPIGQSSEWVTPEATQRLAEELAKIPPPRGNPRLEADFDQLRRLVAKALENPDLALVFTVS